MEELAEQGPLTEAQVAEVAELRRKVQQWQKRKDGDVRRYWEGKAVADRVAVLEELAARGPLTGEQEAELAELRPKAQRSQKKKERRRIVTRRERLLLIGLRCWRS
ncbi:hypothetical protein [Saccharopolyspora spinosa]|uniref:hypothetical protein n=1 Tax=Saccharopolyspora spinosa TaxID=60894 RepID=UPI00376EBCB8